VNYNILQKRLIYKANNRGWKETDILLGGFVNKNIDKLTNEQLMMLDILLDQADAEIFNWITKKILVPAEYDNIVMKMLQSFNNF
jgi:antitoxin CptB